MRGAGGALPAAVTRLFARAAACSPARESALPCSSPMRRWRSPCGRRDLPRSELIGRGREALRGGLTGDGSRTCSFWPTPVFESAVRPTMGSAESANTVPTCKRCQCSVGDPLQASSCRRAAAQAATVSSRLFRARDDFHCHRGSNSDVQERRGERIGSELCQAICLFLLGAFALRRGLLIRLIAIRRGTCP